MRKIKQLPSFYWVLLKKTTQDFFKHDAFGLSAGIAFYTIFSLPAILIFTVMIGSSLFDQENVEETLLNQIDGLLGPESVKTVEGILRNASLKASTLWAKAVAIGTLMFSATTVFVSLQAAINNLWRIKPKPKREALKFVVNRFLSLAMVASLGFLTLISLIAHTALAILHNWLATRLSHLTLLIVDFLNFTISTGFVVLVFAIIFKVLPDAKIKWSNVWVGSLVTTVLFTVGKQAIGIYLGSSDVGGAYGAAGSTIVILIWVYYTVLILLYGAQFTASYVTLHGDGITPKHAVLVKETEIGLEAD